MRNDSKSMKKMKKRGLQGYLNMKVKKRNRMKREVNEEGW